MLRSTFFYRTNFEMLACGHLLLPLLWISSYKPWQRMTHQIHDAAPDMKCRRSVLVPKCAAQSQQKVILTAQKSYLTKCHCIALQVCIFAIALTPFSISYLRNLIVKLAPLKLCDIAAAKSKATWVEITPYLGFFIRYWSKLIDIFGLSDNLFLGIFWTTFFLGFFLTNCS